MNERRESPAGFHYYGAYRDCPRKFYLAYVLGLRPKTKHSALSFGIALHEATAAYLTSPVPGDASYAQVVLAETLEASRSEYEDDERYQLDFSRAPLLLDEWIKTWGRSDLELYEILGTEMELTVPIGPPEAGLIFTVRLDRVYKERRTGNVYIVEAKTTGWGADKMWQKTAGSDQITAQLWAASKIHPEWNCRSVLIDVMYQRTMKGKVVGQPICSRGPSPAFKTQYDLNVFELGMFSTIIEISQKVKALTQYPWPMLFPLHKNYCSLYDCEYCDICGGDVQPGQCPPGFERDPRVSQEVDERFRKIASYNLEHIKMEFK